MKRRTYISILLLLVGAFSFSQDISWSFQAELNNQGKFVQNAIYSPYRQWTALSLGADISILDELGHEIYSTKRNNTYGDICFSPDEKYLLIRNWRAEGDIAFLDLNTLLVKNVLQKEGFLDAHRMAFAGDIHHLLFFSPKGMTLFYMDDKADLTFLQKFHTEAKNDIREFSVSENGQWLAVSETGTIHLSDDNKYIGFGITLYERKGDKYVQKDEYNTSTTKHFVQFVTGTEKLMISVEKEYGDKENALIFFDCSKGKFNQIDRLELEREVEYAGFSKDGKWMAGSSEGITFYYLGKNKIEKHNEKLYYYWQPFILEFSPDGKHLMAFQKDKELVQWNLDGVGGDIRSKLYNTLAIDFSPAFKTVLSGCTNCFDELDKNLLQPKGEFETSEQFEKRREKAKNEVLGVLQTKLEEQNKIMHNGQTCMKNGYLLGYNADREIFKANILGEEVAINVKLNEAPKFKSNFSSSLVTFSKRKSENIVLYENFKVLDTKSGTTYPFTFKNDPFNYLTKQQRTGDAIGAEDPEDIAPAKITSSSKNDTTKQVYALIIATNNYKEFSDLKNPVLDGETISKELQDRYGCSTEVLTDPTLVNLQMKLREYAAKEYKKNDELLIFIAGHGHFDNIYKEGYIVTADSRLNDEAQVSFLSHSNLKTIVKNIPCEHILLVMDVCFGGTFDQAIATGSRGKDIYQDVDMKKYIERKLQYKTRLVMTSGGKRYVPDGRPGQHSPFARNFLAALRSDGGDDGVLTVSEIKLFLEKTDTQPYFGEFDGNEPGSDFILMKSKNY